MSVLIKCVNIPGKIILTDLRAGIHWRHWIGSRGGSSRQIQAIPIPPFAATLLIHLRRQAYPFRYALHVHSDDDFDGPLVDNPPNPRQIFYKYTLHYRLRHQNKTLPPTPMCIVYPTTLSWWWTPKLTGTSKSTLRYLSVCSSASQSHSQLGGRSVICRQSYLSAQTTNELR